MSDDRKRHAAMAVADEEAGGTDLRPVLEQRERELKSALGGNTRLRTELQRETERAERYVRLYDQFSRQAFEQNSTIERVRAVQRELESEGVFLAAARLGAALEGESE